MLVVVREIKSLIIESLPRKKWEEASLGYTL